MDSIDPGALQARAAGDLQKTWLNVGRVERLPKTGQLLHPRDAVGRSGTSVIIVKDKDGTSSGAFYNMCRHRGNKLVWNDYPGEEVSRHAAASSPASTTRWRYGLNGDLTFVQQEDEFFDLDKATTGWCRCAARCGKGSSSSTSTTTPNRWSDYLGDFAKGLEGYPFHEMTETLQLPGRGQRELEAVHRRVHRVLPRADPAS